jgi:hypothetical protein
MSDSEKQFALLRAQLTAIIGMLQWIPAGDGKPILGPERWPAYEAEFRKQAHALGIEGYASLP